MATAEDLWFDELQPGDCSISFTFRGMKIEASDFDPKHIDMEEFQRAGWAVAKAIYSGRNVKRGEDEDEDRRGDLP